MQPLQVHKDYLQLAVEGWRLLLVPALVMIGLAARRIMRAVRMPQEPMTWWVRMGAIAGIFGMAVHEISECSLQIPGVALLFGACLALAMHEPAAPVVRASSRRGHLAS